MALTSFEEQELNELKSWWQDNYKTIIAVVVLSLAGSFGWRYWQDHQVTKTQEISAQYDQIILSNQSAEVKNAEIDAFAKEHNKTAYATLALFEKAKLAVEAKDYQLAAVALQQAITEAPDDILASLAALRLASVQLQLNETDAALATLNNQVKDASLEARKLLLIGDIQAAKGDKAAAKASYEQAQKNASPLEQEWLQVRLNNL